MQINASIPNLIGGVSQQPDVLRAPSQMRELVNATCDPARGLSKRPPTNHLAVLQNFGGGGVYTTLEFENRGIYHLQITSPSGIRMCDEAGVAVTIVDKWGEPLNYHPYLASGNPTASLKLIKEADTVFIVNTERVVTEDITPPTGAPWPTLVWIKTGAYGRDYSITIPGLGVWTYTTPDGSTSSHITQTKTDAIAANLGAQMVSAGVSGVVVRGSVISIAGEYAGLSVSDSMGESAIGLVSKAARSITDLPSRNVPDGFTVKVEGGDASASGDYYVRYSAADRVWRETRHPADAWGVPTASTMPLRLVPVTFSTFRLSSPEWVGRTVGDADSNPSPSFVGRSINDLFFYQDRMGLVSGEGFDLSEVGQYYNHYRTTVRDLLDTDPVQATVSHPKVATLRHAVPFRKRLLLFSSKAQFEVQGGDVLTPRTVTTPVVAEFESSSQVRPVGVGASLYFPADRGAYSAVFNFSLVGDAALEHASDTSAQVPQYIPNNVTMLQVSPVNNMAFVVSPDAPRNIYVYQFYDNGPDRIQSAWHRWDLGPNAVIRSLTVVASDLRVLVERTRGGVVQVCSEVIYLSSGQLIPRLDRGQNVQVTTVVNIDGIDYTEFPLPYTPDDVPHVLVVASGPVPAGASFPVTITQDGGGYRARVKRNLLGCQVTFGALYEMRATLGRFVFREQAGSGATVVTRGRTQVSRMAVNYSNANTFAVLVEVEGRPTINHKATGQVVGSGTRGRIGQSLLSDGKFACPVLSDNVKATVTLINDTSSPCSFTSVDWEGFHISRGRHVG